MPFLKDYHIETTVAMLENTSSTSSHSPFQTVDLDLSQGSSNDVATSLGAPGAAAVGVYTATRSKREIIALDGVMFDSSILLVRDDQVIIDTPEPRKERAKEGKE